MPSSARSLAEHLRLLSDDRLTAVLTLRPDLLRPVPKSLADLALRVNSAASVILALDDLTREQLQVLEAACALAPAGRFGVTDLAEHLDGDPDRVRRAIIDLTTRVLLWGTDGDVRVPSEVRTAMGPHPAGLDPVVRENLIGVRLALADPDAFADRLALAPADARELLQRHAWGPPEIPEAPGRDWLARQDFMAVDDAGTVIVPREIALVLRRGALSPDPLETPPAPRTADETLVAAADRHAGHAADQFVRDAERVLRQLQHRPLRRQANGILRDWDTFVPTTGVAADQAALVLALAWDRGLVDLDDDSLLRPTSALDRSLTHSIARRWGEWVAAWLALERPAHDSRHVTGTGRDPQVPAARRMVLTALADGAGTEVLGWTAWYRPRSRIPGALLAASAADAETLGLAFGGILSSAGLAAAAGVTTADALGDTVAPSLPALTDRVILQADLTATALGPLDAAVERRLSEVADWESGGAAAVFRFTPDSVRAALARGADGAETLQWLRGVSATELPQALTVLFSDAAAALPTAQVHDAHAVITCEPDEAERLLADPALAHLGLRAIGPGTLTSQASGDEVAAALTAGGRAAARPRQSPPTPTPHRPAPRAIHPADPARVVQSLRHIEAGSTPEVHPPTHLAPVGPGQVQSELATAVGEHRRLWLTFAGDDGRQLTHLLEPLHLAGGDVSAFDHTAGEIRTIPVERIVASAVA